MATYIKIRSEISGHIAFFLAAMVALKYEAIDGLGGPMHDACDVTAETLSGTKSSQVDQLVVDRLDAM